MPGRERSGPLCSKPPDRHPAPGSARARLLSDQTADLTSPRTVVSSRYPPCSRLVVIGLVTGVVAMVVVGGVGGSGRVRAVRAGRFGSGRDRAPRDFSRRALIDRLDD